MNLEALAWLERIAAALTKGYVLSIDYGFTRAESVRFPAGTLMGYRRHTAREDVLAEAGLARHHRARQLHGAPRERRRSAASRPCASRRWRRRLLAAGEADQFAAALGAGGTAEELRRRMQLKTLLFGMGETFRVLLQRKMEEGSDAEKRREKS